MNKTGENFLWQLIIITTLCRPKFRYTAQTIWKLEHPTGAAVISHPSTLTSPHQMTPSPQQADIATLKYHSPCGNMYTGSGDCDNMHVKIFNQIENKHLDCVTVECRQSIRS